jgi:hypothetical protein
VSHGMVQGRGGTVPAPGYVCILVASS